MANFEVFETDDKSIAKLLKQVCKEFGEIEQSNRKLLDAGQDVLAGKSSTRQRILDSSPETQVVVLMFVLRAGDEQKYNHGLVHTEITMPLFARQLPYQAQDVQFILEYIISFSGYGGPSLQKMLKSLATALKNPQTLKVNRPKLKALKTKALAWNEDVVKRKFLRLLEDILNPEQDESIKVNILPDEWGTQARAHLDTLNPDLLERWQAVLGYATTVKGSKPTQKWLEGANPVLEALGDADFVRLLEEWLGFFCRSRFQGPISQRGDYQVSSLLTEENADLFRALIWLSSNLESASLASSLASSLANTALAAFRKVPGYGPRSPKVGTACVWALENMSGMHAAAQLERIRLGVKQPQYQKVLEGALNRVSERVGLSREDLEELTVPTFDLEHEQRSVSFGDARAELTVSGTSVQLEWFGADGKPRKAVPASVKSELKDNLKALKKTVDDLQKMLSAQSSRLEHLPLKRRSWLLPTFRERYLEHPLMGTLSRRLLWHVQDGGTHYDAFWLEGNAVNAAGEVLEFSDEAVVTPWHPVFCDASEVLAWREFLEQREIVQPFKQAHREIYLLTEAERRTLNYSNRFAAHILKQHQFNALCAARGWVNKLRLDGGDSYPPATLELPLWNLRAEFWVEGIVGETDVGIYLYLATDQVRFYPMNALQNYSQPGGHGYTPAEAWRGDSGVPIKPVALEQIPPLVLSEVLRDVDLFVGVGSVGGDPTWRDGGPQGHRAYWENYSFGELSSSAEERRKLLEKLLPRLKIREKTTLEGRFLKVRGELRTYKIHLGSGNILMEPNDQYLCIVPGSLQTSSSDLRLPFEGDRTLAVILSKAFMLASDTQITDVTITRQLSL